MLPHVGVGEFCETKKAYYFGYVLVLLVKPCGLVVGICKYSVSVESSEVDLPFVLQVYYSPPTDVCSWPKS